MIDYAQILLINYPKTNWSLDGDFYSGLNWFDESPKPTQAELDALWESTKKILDNKNAEIERHNAYIKESDPLFFKAQRGECSIDDWKNKVSEIKNRYPKAV